MVWYLNTGKLYFFTFGKEDQASISMIYDSHTIRYRNAEVNIINLGRMAPCTSQHTLLPM